MTSKPVVTAARRVLVADDVDDISEFVSRVLRREGYEVLKAEDGEQALEVIASWKPDLVVLDIMLPKLHGIDVLKRMREMAGQRAGVIVCSAKSFNTEIGQARELGAYAFLAKPFGRLDLLDAVRGYFDSLSRPQSPAASPAGGAVIGAGEPYIPQLDSSRGYWKLWGTRGSIPVANPRFLRHGGNTSCLEVRCGETLVIIDAGSGIRDLGLELARQGPRRIDLFVGHTHWDHIQGFPFFAPAYLPGFEIHVYGAHGFGKDLEGVFRGQLDRDYFPVELEDMQARIEFHLLPENPLVLGPVRVFWEFMNHPGAVVGFRVETENKRIAYVTDNEFLKGYLGPPAEVEPDCPALAPFRKIIDFVSGVDLLIAEAQYLNEEYVKKVGWGHSSVSNACILAAQAKVRRWLITHHDPLHDDDFLDRKLLLTRQVLASLNQPTIHVDHAHDELSELL